LKNRKDSSTTGTALEEEISFLLAFQQGKTSSRFVYL